MVAVVSVEIVIAKLIHIVLDAALDTAGAQPGVTCGSRLFSHGADIAQVGVGCFD